MRAATRRTVIAFAAIALSIELCTGLPPTGVAHAATNSAATNAINTMKAERYFKPGSPCPSGTNVGWLVNGSYNCDNECYALISGATKQIFGNHTFISGVTAYGYKATNPGNYTCIGTLIDTPTTQPSLAQVKSLLGKAHPGDVIQFKGGPNSYAKSAQHTALVESVDNGGIRVYQHANKPIHINSTYYSWSTFYNNYLNFNVNTNWNKGISLYHYKSYTSKFPSHTHNYAKVIKTSYSYKQNSGTKHTAVKTCQCSCGATTTKTVTESCSYSNNKCTHCGISKTSPYTFKPVTIDEGVYKIHLAKNKNYVLEVQGGSSELGANIQLYGSNSGGAQFFSFVRNPDDGSYGIVNIQSGKALETSGWNKSNGGNISQHNWITTHDNKRWYIGKLADGTYVLKNKHSGLFLECKGGTAADRTNIQQYAGNFENNNFKNAQKWVLAKSSIIDTSITSLSARENAISVSWKKQERFNNGFQIRFATAKSMTNARMVEEPSATSKSKSVSGFKPGTTYYVQVRSYKQPYGSNGRFYSAWSPTMSVKTSTSKSTTNQVINSAVKNQPSASASENAKAPAPKPVKVTTKSTSITKLSKGKRSFTVKWKAQKKHASGYQVSWSIDKKFKKGVKSKLVKGAKKTSLKVSRLKAKKTYYVKVRTYKQVGKGKYYSAWSKVQKVETKK